VLLVFAGVWALMHGVSDIIRAFMLRSLPEAAEPAAIAPASPGPAGPRSAGAAP